MGSFLFVDSSLNRNFEESKVLKLFEKFGCKLQSKESFEGTRIYSWGKTKDNTQYFRNDLNGAIYLSGTAIYKGCENEEESISRIYQDLLDDNWDFSNVKGTYSFLFSKDKKQFNLYQDHSGIANVYYSSDKKIFSNSFLAILYSKSEKLKLNKWAITEVLTSGRLVGPDTIFQDIFRFEIFTDKNLSPLIPVINSELIDNQDITRLNFDDSVDQQLDALNTYFEDIAPFALKNGVDSGLTGGHDSRIILSLLMNHIEKGKIQVHSFWRVKKDVELSIAEKVAEKAELNLKSIKTTHHFKMTNDEMTENLEEAMYFYDAHVRMHCFFTESYNTLKHRLDILGDFGLGLNGVGGEQYRNEWHMERPKWSMNYFIKHFLCYQIGGKAINNKSFELDYFDYLESKISKRLKLGNSQSIDKFNVKRYLNEVYVSSLMGARTNAENKVNNFLTPFVDREITKLSYNSLPHQGLSFHFQQEMMRRLNPDLASVQSGYGYSFNKGEPTKNKLKYLLKEYTPKQIYLKQLEKKFEKYGSLDFEKYNDKFEIVRESINYLRSLYLPLDESKLISRPDLLPVYISMAFQLNFLNKEIGICDE